jgi:hypothetical protein
MDMITLKTIAENTIIYGGAAAALGMGVRRVYRIARNVEKLVENSNTAIVAHAQLKEDFDRLDSTLMTHIRDEESRNNVRDSQLSQLTDYMNEIIVELRPNGGSSIKDMVNITSKNVALMSKRVGSSEQSKPKKIVARKLTRKSKKSKKIR